MSTALRVLIVEDRVIDAEIVIREMRRSGLEVEWCRVETEEAFRTNLHSNLDLILSDYELPTFNGLRALQLLNESGLDVPFILVSGTIGEETAVAAIKMGASDYLLKDRLTRLGAAATHAIAAARLRREQRRADLALRAAQAQLKQLLQHSPAVLYTLQVEGHGLVPYTASENLARLLGSTEVEASREGWWVGQLHPEDRDRAVASIGETIANDTSLTEYRMRHGAGGYRWVADNRRLVRNDNGGPAELVGVWTDVTERKDAEQALQQTSERLALATRSARLGIWDWDILTDSVIWDAQMYALYGMVESWGASARAGWRNGLHPDDQQHVASAIAAAISGTNDFDLEFRVCWPGGEVRHIESHAVVQRADDGSAVRMTGVSWDITDRKRAEMGIKRLAAVVESSDDAIISEDLEGVVTTWNAGADHLFGFAADEMVGTTMARIIPSERRGEKAQILARVTRGDSVLHFETQRVCRDGRLLDVSLTASPIRDAGGKVTGMSKVARDISAQKESNGALRASEQRFKALFEQAAVGVAQVEAASGRFVQVNQRFCAIVGRGARELEEEQTFSAINRQMDTRATARGQNEANGTGAEEEHDDALNWQRMRQSLAGPSREFSEETRYVRGDGSEVWATVTMSAMWAPGDIPDYFIAVVQDITERKLLEAQFRQAQKMEAIGTLAGGIAHDFNNVLAAITGFTELSQLALPDNSKVHEYLDCVMQASARATDLIRQILTFSLPQKLERQPVQLQPIVTETMKLLRASIPSTIEFEISLKDAPMVLANATQIHQLLLNLGTNAWHAMKERAGKLHVTLERIVVDASEVSSEGRLRPGSYARLTVRDSGCGMDEATLRRIFEPFFTTKSVGEGTGLGLSVVHGIMASHDRVVTAFSELGRGTVFHLFFPALSSPASVDSVVAEPVPRGHGERVLFVDDEPMLVRLGERILTSLGYVVEVATESGAALAIFRAAPRHFSLILSDQTMPQMTGLELAREILNVRSDIPIVLMTGNGLSLTPERLKAAGIHQLLLKPTTIESLGRAVHAAIYSTAQR